MRTPPLTHPVPQWVRPTTIGVPLEYKVELITPMFGGGVKARTVDTGMPIRAREVRGQLRFWWRLLAKHKNLREAEELIWGGISGDDENEKSNKGVIDIRVSTSQEIKAIPLR